MVKVDNSKDAFKNYVFRFKERNNMSTFWPIFSIRMLRAPLDFYMCCQEHGQHIVIKL